jgi:hypothetical protein
VKTPPLLGFGDVLELSSNLEIVREFGELVFARAFRVCNGGLIVQDSSLK